MIDYAVMEQMGTSDEQLRKVFAEWDGKGAHARAHRKLRKKISARIQEGFEWSLRHAHHYYAADLLWDGVPILPSIIPLTQFAQGKLRVNDCIKQLEDLKCSDKFVSTEVQEVDGQKREVKKLDMAKFVETCVQIGRSYISRRTFAQTNKYNRARPFLPYETRFPTQVGKLRAELMGQYAQIMADNYAYPHLQTQYTRDMFLYARSFVFPDCAWDEERQTRRASDKKKPDGTWPLKTTIVREGVPFTQRHPSRCFYDTSYAPTSLNTDSGCQWVGFWDVWRYGDVRGNEDFFNRDRVKYSSDFASMSSLYGSYFDVQFGDGPPMTIRPPKSLGTLGMAEVNSRAASSAYYASDDDDVSVMLTDIRMKLVPRDWGLGGYPHPVWLRLLVASDETVVFAEWLPSRPAFVASFNENDSRLINQGQAHEIMPIQDQVSNIMSQLLLCMKHSLLRILAINKDTITKETKEKIEKVLSGESYYEKPHLLFYSFSELAELGIDPKQAAVINLVEAKSSEEYINNAFKAIIQLLGILERLLMLSPQEQGQPAPREISATEVAAIEATTSSVYSAISDAIEEARAAQRVIIYESAMAKASNEIYLPVSQSFGRETIEAAGLEFEADEVAQERMPSTVGNRKWTVIGTKDVLEHNYIFTGRDTGDRPTNAKSAEVMIQLLAQVIPLIGPEALGKERIFEMINEIARLLGIYSLKLEIGETENEQLGEPEIKEAVTQLAQQLKSVAEEGSANGETIAALTEQIEKLGQGFGQISQLLDQQQAALTASGGMPTPIQGR